MNDPHGLGPALAFDEHPPDASPAAPWRTVTERISAAMVTERVGVVQSKLGSPGADRVDARVAASTEHFGFVARLVSAHVCGSALGLSFDLSTSQIWWHQPQGGWLQLSLARTTNPRNALQHGAIADFTATVQQLYGASPRVLWGNVGSAANSTLTLLRQARPDLLAPARAAADELLRDPRIDGGELRTGPAFRRRSCCLIYKAGIGLCGDCVLRG